MNFNPPNDPTTPKEWHRWFTAIGRACGSITASGTTSNRPTQFTFIGRYYFDTTLGKPVWYDGTNWVDATGATV